MDNNANYGILHTHTEFSIRDSAMTIKQLFERAKALNAPAVALTDHGILTGIMDFMKMGKEYGINAIPGIEAYFKPEDDRFHPRQHLILMAKDMLGYHGICQAVKQSYRNIVKDQPCVDLSILKEVFAPGSEYHGHVIATSACINGPLASILLEDSALVRSTEKLTRQRDKYHPVDEEVGNAVYQEETMAKEIEELTQKRDKLTEESKINLTGYKRTVKALKPEDPAYQEAVNALEEATERKNKASEQLSDIKRLIATKKREKSAYSKSISALKTSAEKWANLDEKINQTLALRQGDEALYQKATTMCLELASIFGEGNFYIELQYHHISDEKKVMPLLAKMATELNIPVVAANDAHYATNDRDDIRARTLVAAMRFREEVKEDEEGYGELYIRSDNELRAALSEIIPPEIVNASIANIGKITGACHVELSHGDHYPVFPVENGESASERLRRLAKEGISKRYPGKLWKPEYETRMEYELGIIDKMGYSDYLCIVQDFLEYGRQLGYQNPEKIGYTIGPGRGSAVGSIVCYLSGITSVDPMRYNLLFERFLNPERVSMPDIDSDFSPEIREQVIAYVQDKYRSKDPKVRVSGTPTCSIITKGTMKAKMALKNVASVTNIPSSIADALAKQVPNEVHATIDDIPDLEEQCSANPVVKQLVSDAKLVEGTVIQYGMHAAGVIIADNGDVSQYTPLYRNIKGNECISPWIAQLDMGQCEGDAGLLKMDFLGLNNLGIITDTLRRIYRNYGVRVDVENLEEEPEVFANIFSAGNTDSVFQFESGGMKDMLRQFRPNSMEDIVLLVAAYRPGPMQYIPDIIKVKHGKQAPHYVAEGLEEILAPTYGYPIYQEQVMQIFNKICGFSLGEADVIRRAMSKKKLAVLTDPKTNYRGRVIDGFIAHGATQEDAEAFWEQLLDFANYAFNKSHAAAYATVAYQTAWLKYHYMPEYMCSVMSRTTYEKLPALIANCRKAGMRISLPDINHSDNTFTNEDSTILYGFDLIKGVGTKFGSSIIKERAVGGRFTSVKDFVVRMLDEKKETGYTRKTMENLIKAGAFDSFCDGNRASLLDSIEDFSTAVKNLAKKQEIYDTRSEALKALQDKGASASEIKKAESSVRNAKKSLDTAKEIYAQHNFIAVAEDMSAKLADEYALLGFYVSGNPFSEYNQSAKAIKGRMDIVDAVGYEGSTVTVCGMIKNLDVMQRKADGRPFCSFILFDESGEVEVKCFTEKYALYSKMIVDGAAIAVKGKVRMEHRTQDDGTEIEMGITLSVYEMSPLKRNSNERIIITGTSVADWIDNYDAVRGFADVNGCDAYFTDAVDLQLRKIDFTVSKSILSASLPGLSISISSI